MPESAPPRHEPRSPGEEVVTCAGCGRPTPHRRYCSECGAALPGHHGQAWGQAQTGAQPAVDPDGRGTDDDHDARAWGQAATGAQPQVAGGDDASRDGPDERTGDAGEVEHDADAATGVAPAARPGGEADRAHAGPTDTASRPYTPMRFSDDVAEDPEPRERRAPQWRTVVGAVVALVVIILGAIVWSITGAQRGPDATAPVVAPTTRTPATASQVRAAALAVDGLLDQGAAYRRLATRAAHCSVSAQRARFDIYEAYNGRRALLARLKTADFAVLPRGTELQDELKQAWTESMYADAQLGEWAEARTKTSAPCSENTKEFQQARIRSKGATRHKIAFASLWENNVRAPLNLPTRRTADGI